MKKRLSNEHGNERGAALIEFAMVVPIFLVLAFGIIDFGLVLNDYNSLRQGVREGAREAVVANWGAECTGSTNQKLTCLVEDRIDLGSESAIKVNLPTTYDIGEQVEVCAQIPIGSTTGFFTSLLDNKVLKSSITMRIEAIDTAEPLTAFAETAPTGSDWAWC
jgi:hypothetical protein